MASPYEIGKQPCPRFVETSIHECYRCGKTVAFCGRCLFDHHESGSETCIFTAKQGIPVREPTVAEERAMSELAESRADVRHEARLKADLLRGCLKLIECIEFRAQPNSEMERTALAFARAAVAACEE